MASRLRFGVAGGLACALLTVAPMPAKAQNLFQELFGGIARVFASHHRADPMETLARAPDGVVSQRQDNGPSRAFCVRTCDGHFFPVESHGHITAVTACQSACPAADTKLYSGSNIDYATARDGSRYADLPTAFLFRNKLVAGCTCNGRTAFGIVPQSPENDPTLRPGDVVATRNGLMAVTASGQLAPAASYAGFSRSERAQFSQMKITPQYNIAPASTASVRPQTDEKSAALSR